MGRSRETEAAHADGARLSTDDPSIAVKEFDQLRQFLLAVFQIALFERGADTRVNMGTQNGLRGSGESALNRSKLVQDLHTIRFRLHHSTNPRNLSLDPFEPVDHFLFRLLGEHRVLHVGPVALTWNGGFVYPRGVSFSLRKNLSREERCFGHYVDFTGALPLPGSFG